MLTFFLFDIYVKMNYLYEFITRKKKNSSRNIDDTYGNPNSYVFVKVQLGQLPGINGIAETPSWIPNSSQQMNRKIREKKKGLSRGTTRRVYGWKIWQKLQLNETPLWVFFSSNVNLA